MIIEEEFATEEELAALSPECCLADITVTIAPVLTDAQISQLASDKPDAKATANNARLNCIRESERRISELHLELMEIQGRASSIKKLIKARLDELKNLKLEDWDSTAAVDGVDTEGSTEMTTAEALGQTNGGGGMVEQPAPARPAPTKPTDWRSTPIESLDLPESICNALRENPKMTIATIGDLSDWCKQRNLLTDIKKIGSAKAEKIEAALEKFWRENPQVVENVAANVTTAVMGELGKALAEAGVTPESVSRGGADDH